MSLRQRYLKIPSQMMPAGAVGVSLLLGAAAPGDATQHPADSRLSAADRSPVAERLAAIRQAAISKPHFPIPKPCRAAAIDIARCAMPSRHRDEAEVVLPPFPLRKMCLQRMIEPIRFVAELTVHA